MDAFRNRVWHGLYNAKYNSLYMAELIRTHRVRVRYLDIAIALSAGAGALLSQAIPLAPLVATIIITIGSLFKVIRPAFFMSENQLASADMQHQFYELLLFKLERLWLELESNVLTHQQAIDNFFELLASEEQHIIPTNQLCAFFTLNTESIHHKSDQYVNQIFYSDPATDNPEPG